MNKCEKCGFLHYRTDPCRPSKGTSTNIKVAGENRDLITRPTPRNAGENPEVPAIPKPKRSGNRHRPGYFTEYMRDYRKGIRRRKSNPNTPERNDE